MKDFNQIKEESKKFVKENKIFFDRFNNEIDDLSIGNYFDLYFGSKGINSLNTGIEFDNDYDEAIKNFFENGNDSHKRLVIGFLDFLIWLKQQQETFNVDMTERKQLHKNALEYSNTVNRIYLNKELDKKDKIEILLFYYCSLQEIFKNIVQEELLLKVWKQEKTDVCNLRKKHIQLGDFKGIMEKYEKQNKQNNKISNIFDVELRNKILHADYLINKDKISYDSKEIKMDDLQIKIIELAVSLQFFVLFYLRLFYETKEFNKK